MEIEIQGKKVNVIFSKEVKEQLAKQPENKEKVIETLKRSYTKFTAVKSDEFMIIDKEEGYSAVFETMDYAQTVIVQHLVPNSRVL